MYVFLFFFQAEDGIRDPLVTGVQTCALPISSCTLQSVAYTMGQCQGGLKAGLRAAEATSRPRLLCRGRLPTMRSEERRVGKACGRWLWRGRQPTKRSEERAVGSKLRSR